MPTLPLFDSKVFAAEAGHHVKAPGGYETWRFVAYDPATQTWIRATVHQGFPRCEYVRRYLLYRRWPTRFAPPLPQEFSAVDVAIFSRDQTVSSTIRFDRTPLEFSDGAVQLLIPRNDIPGIDLIFRSKILQNPIEVSLSPDHGEGETHRWVIDHGLCDVSGSVDLGQTKVAFAGNGFHDQRFGTAPVLRPSMHGAVFLKDRAIVFHRTDQMLIAMLGAQSAAIEINAASGSSWRRTLWGLSYPRVLRLAEKFVLSNPRLVDSHAISARIFYEAMDCGERGVACCEVVAPNRMRWPVLGQWLCPKLTATQSA